MFLVGYDDHNRAGRMLQADHARNTLASCEPNAILFTGGDNDTFPLWYVQEVEGFRTDVRVIVLSYFNGDWYIDQMQRQMYDSSPIPFSLSNEDYRQGGLNDVLPFVKRDGIEGSISLNKFLELVRNKNKSIQVEMKGGTRYNSIPSPAFFLDIDRNEILQSGQVPGAKVQHIPDKLHIFWKGNYMQKSAFMVLDLIASNQWRRPIYFNATSLHSISMDLRKHVLQEGLVCRLLPIALDEPGGINLEKMYENLMKKWQFRNLEDEDVYYNHEDYQLRILQPIKSSYNILTRSLLYQKETERAREVINHLHANFVKQNIRLDITDLQSTELLFAVGEKEKAISMAGQLYSQANDELSYLATQKAMETHEGQIRLFILRRLGVLTKSYGFGDFSIKCSEKLLDFVADN